MDTDRVFWSRSIPLRATGALHGKLQKDATTSENQDVQGQDTGEAMFETFDHHYEQYISAIRGEAVPEIMNTVGRCAIVRGIRCHYDFANSPQVVELCTTNPQLARARNARLIMSGHLPDGLDLLGAEDRPYCIWHPDIASEQVYRQLAHRYPFMRYQVARACAVAGFWALYERLDTLPDIAIAEEARESGTEGGQKIYETIMSAPARYSVMKDYDCTINTVDPLSPAFLNGDTGVRWMLTIRTELSSDFLESSLAGPDIEEDGRISDCDMFQVHERDQNQSELFPTTIDGRLYLSVQESMLLYKPLPRDLPTVRKDLLIQMAAYEGNIDRYARLMRPYSMTSLEVACVVRGIFHHTMFARFWADELKTNSKRITPRDALWHISEAVNSRRVMINDISSFSNETEYLPYLIWWPLQPKESCLAELMEKCPRMREAISIAAVICDYRNLYDKLQVEPDGRVWLAAKQSANPYYREDLERRAEEHGTRHRLSGGEDIDGRSDCIGDIEPTTDRSFAPLSAYGMLNSIAEFGPYIGDRADPMSVERYVWMEQSHLMKYVELYGPCSWTGGLEWVEEEWKESRGVDGVTSVS